MADEKARLFVLVQNGIKRIAADAKGQTLNPPTTDRARRTI